VKKALVFVLLLSACAQPDDNSCTVTDSADGALVSCSDGTSQLIRDGEDGVDGTNGVDGVNGADGTDGRDGVDGQDATIDFCELLSYDCLSYTIEACAVFTCDYNQCDSVDELQRYCESIFKIQSDTAALGATCQEMALYARDQPCQ
jgi:hypothetical protein